jgi:type IV pilus assembly protein PilO
MEKLIEQFQKTPLAQKLGALVILLVAMSAGNYFGLISPLEDTITSLRKHQADLDAEYTQKKTIANNLNSYRARMEKLQQDLDLALTELPQEAQIDELLRQLNDVGKKAGLAITAVKPGNEEQGPQPFIAKIPIGMSVQGSYEEIAVFFESVSKLRRIVNINDITLGAPAKKNEKVELTATFAATTFRFKPAPPAAANPTAPKPQ